jgi:hypothetical protein
MTNSPICFEQVKENDVWFGIEPEHFRDFNIDLNLYHDGKDTYVVVYHRYDDDPDFMREPFLSIKITTPQEDN